MCLPLNKHSVNVSHYFSLIFCSPTVKTELDSFKSPNLEGAGGMTVSLASPPLFEDHCWIALLNLLMHMFQRKREKYTSSHFVGAHPDHQLPAESGGSPWSMMICFHCAGILKWLPVSVLRNTGTSSLGLTLREDQDNFFFSPLPDQWT